MTTFDASSLERVVPFDRMSSQVRERLAPLFEVAPFAKDEYIFARGDPRRAFFIILDGEIDIVDESLGFARSVVVSGPGTVVGEPVVIEDDGGVHALGAKAVADGALARMTREKIDALRRDDLDTYTELLMGVARLMARRMTHASRSGRGQAAVFSAGFRAGSPRLEHDLLGEREVPARALWGIQTLRAVENFPISGVRLDHFPSMIEALAMIKRACARANRRLGLLDEAVCDAIVRACDELRRGLWHGHFVVDMIQGGAGTSTNMNANEVIANRALQISGHPLGDYETIHPNNHVNMSQSTNDVYPSAIKIAALLLLDKLVAEAELLAGAFSRKAEEFADVIKMGRTQLQDAVPMTLGQELNTWSITVAETARRIRATRTSLEELNIGGTAIGTGINTDPRYAALVIEELRAHSGMDLRLAPDLVEATQDTSSFVELAGVLKMLAVRLSKVCNDLRLLSSGPRCGLNEINLPAVQPGSSIMPGKVNPVIPEVVNQVAFQIVGLDAAVALASEGGQLQLNVFEPLIAFDLFTSIKMMRNAMRTLRLRCVDGITANEQVCREMVHRSIGLVTALNPYIGYDNATQVAKEALATGRRVYDIVLEKGLMAQDLLDELLSPAAMTRPTLHAGPAKDGDPSKA